MATSAEVETEDKILELVFAANTTSCSSLTWELISSFLETMISPKLDNLSTSDACNLGCSTGSNDTCYPQAVKPHQHILYTIQNAQTRYVHSSPAPLLIELLRKRKCFKYCFPLRTNYVLEDSRLGTGENQWFGVGLCGHESTDFQELRDYRHVKITSQFRVAICSFFSNIIV